MAGTRTLFVNIQKLERQGADAGIILRLMMACNDLTLANQALGRYGEDRTEYIRRGAGLYFVRVQIGHLHECLNVIRDIKRSPILRALIGRCPLRVQKRFETLMMYAEGGSKRQEFADHFELVRHNTAFHY